MDKKLQCKSLTGVCCSLVCCVDSWNMMSKFMSWSKIIGHVVLTGKGLYSGRMRVLFSHGFQSVRSIIVKVHGNYTIRNILQ